MRTTRREFVTASALGLTGASMVGAAAEPSAEKPPAGPARALRICFFTDAHLDTDKSHEERILVAFDKANSYKPDAYVFGGDNVFAVDGDIKEEAAQAQFESWKKVVADKVSVPHHSVIGNHDIWNARPKGQDKKALAMAGFGMPGRYYSWRMNGWKFIMLDVFGITGAPVDAEQMTWLRKEVVGEEPVCVVTHQPIFSLTIQLGESTVVGSPQVLRELFLKNPNVRVGLSGHNHMIDVSTLDAVTYACGGAVSGAWWKGEYHHFPPAFLIVDLNGDGSSKFEVVYWEKKVGK